MDQKTGDDLAIPVDFQTSALALCLAVPDSL